MSTLSRQFDNVVIDNHTNQSRTYASKIGGDLASLNAGLWRKSLDPQRFSVATVPSKPQ